MLCEMLLSGTTTVMDMYYFEDAVAEVMDEMGVRGIAGETVMEDATCDAASPEAAISLGTALIERYRNHPRIRGCLAPHGTTTCSSGTYRGFMSWTAKTGLFLHFTLQRWTMR